MQDDDTCDLYCEVIMQLPTKTSWQDGELSQDFTLIGKILSIDEFECKTRFTNKEIEIRFIKGTSSESWKEDTYWSQYIDDKGVSNAKICGELGIFFFENEIDEIRAIIHVSETDFEAINRERRTIEKQKRHLMFQLVLLGYGIDNGATDNEIFGSSTSLEDLDISENTRYLIAGFSINSGDFIWKRNDTKIIRRQTPYHQNIRSLRVQLNDIIFEQPIDGILESLFVSGRISTLDDSLRNSDLSIDFELFENAPDTEFKYGRHYGKWKYIKDEDGEYLFVTLYYTLHQLREMIIPALMSAPVCRLGKLDNMKPDSGAFLDIQLGVNDTDKRYIRNKLEHEDTGPIIIYAIRLERGFSLERQ